MDLDTFFTALYVFVDDWYRQEMIHLMQRHPGPPLKMSDSEVLTVALAAQWRSGVPWQSERGIVRFLRKHGRTWFPNMLGHSQLNQRTRDLWAALVCLQQELAKQLSAEDSYEIVDCAPLKHCSLGHAKSHDRHWLFGKKGHGGNHGSWYFGEQLLLCATDKGIVTGWMTGLANIDDRWMMEAFLTSRQGDMRLEEPELPSHRRKQERKLPTTESFSPAITAGKQRQLPILADGGFNGRRWTTQWKQDYGVDVIVPPAVNTREAKKRKAKLWRWQRGRRQMVETVFARLVKTYGLHSIQAHTEQGMLTLIAAKLAAYNIGVMFNRQRGRPDGSVATLIC